MIQKSLLRYHLPPIVWAAVIFIESSIQGEQIPSTPTGSDKLVHILIFFIFCWLVSRSLGQVSSVLINKMKFFLSVVATIMYGFSDEFHQLYVPGRSADIYDVAADAAGAILFVLIAKAFFNRSARQQDTIKPL